jgi:hypothetical protein
MNYCEFGLLTEQLPCVVDGFTVKYELLNSKLYARIHPSGPYERMSFRWESGCRNGGLIEMCFIFDCLIDSSVSGDMGAFFCF